MTVLSSKKSLLVLCKVSRLFVNTLSGDDKYSLLNRDNLTLSIQILLFQKKRLFLHYLSAFLKSTLSFDYFQEKKMTLIANVFPKLRIPKKVIG